MALVSFLILREDPDKSMKRVYLDHGETVRLFGRFLTLMERLRVENVICQRNPSQCCGTSLECSVTKILLCSTPPVVLEVRCERLSPSGRDILWDWRSMRSLPIWREKPSTDPE